MAQIHHLLIADDHPLFRGALREAVNGLFDRVEVGEAGTFEEVTELLERGGDVDLILLDLRMPGVRGFSGLMYLRAQYPALPIIVVSGALDVEQQLKALQGPRRAHYCLNKPVDIQALKRTVDIALIECGEKEIVHQFEALERSHRIDAIELFSRSTDRLKRQTQIRERLVKSRERPNISALAREFAVARRTIIRDLQELIRRGQLDPQIYPEWEDPREEQ